MKILGKILSRNFLRYVCIGVLAFLLEYISFLLFGLGGLLNGFMLIVAQTISFSLGFLTSFLGNKYITFRDRRLRYRLNTKSQVGNYALLAAINLLLSNVILYVLIDTLNFVPAIAKLFVMSMVFIWNYAIFSRFIFRENGDVV